MKKFKFQRIVFVYAQVKKRFFDQFVHQMISLISAFSVLQIFGKFLTFLLIFMDNIFKEISKLSAK
jgi:hypothetical protein